MRTVKAKISLSENIDSSFLEQRSYATKGKELANAAINVLSTTVLDAKEELDSEISRLEESNLRTGEVYRSLVEQLTEIRDNYEILPNKLKDEVKMQSKSKFVISVFGRTTAGKSTLVEILTRGNGSTIGDGRQGFTQKPIRYIDKNIELFDVPGVAAYNRSQDADIAFIEAKKSNLILFVLSDDGIQSSVAESLSRIISLGKPVICVFNVKVNIDDSQPMSSLQMKMFERGIKNKLSKDHRDALINGLCQYEENSGQNWRKLRFAFVHLKAAFLSQQAAFQDCSEKLYSLSQFEFLKKSINEEIASNGGFYKFKAYTESVSRELVGSVGTLFEQSAENSRNGSVILKKRRELSKWKNSFTTNAEEEIDTFLTRLSGELKNEVCLFSEDNYSNKKAGFEWNKIVNEKRIREEGQKLLEGFAKECEDELDELYRETKYEINFAYRISSENTLNMHRIINGRRIWTWTSAFISGGLVIADLFVKASLTRYGVVFGVLGGLGKLLFKDFEQKAKDAREELERKLTNHIERMIRDLRKCLKDALYKDIIKQIITPAMITLNDLVSSLFSLSQVQFELACRLNEKLKDTNATLISEALSYEGYIGEKFHFNSAVRIPGFAVILVIEDGTRFPDDAKWALQRLLKEQIWFVFQKKDIKSMLGQAIGAGLDRQQISIQKIDNKPRIAHIPSLETVDIYTRQRIEMAQQLTGLLIMK